MTRRAIGHSALQDRATGRKSHERDTHQLIPGPNGFLRIIDEASLYDIPLRTEHRGRVLLLERPDACRIVIAATCEPFGIRTEGSGVDDNLVLAAQDFTTRALIGGGSYRAINMSIANRFGPTMLLTLGGLRVEEMSGNVLSNSGRIIRGLHAASRTAVGLCSHNNLSGVSLADGVFSGRRAGSFARYGAAGSVGWFNPVRRSRPT